jgi:hypothetical protein
VPGVGQTKDWIADLSGLGIALIGRSRKWDNGCFSDRIGYDCAASDQKQKPAMNAGGVRD